MIPFTVIKISEILTLYISQDVVMLAGQYISPDDTKFWLDTYEICQIVFIHKDFL